MTGRVGSISLRILFGVGNPGPEYVGTRHNLGFALLERIAHAAGEPFRPLPGLAANAARVDLAGAPLVLVRPDSYVNRCGPVLAALERLTAAPRDRLLVVVDDLDLAPGRLRLRARGSHGGHNGLRSLAAALGDEQFARLRLGIGGEGARARPEYVLGRFAPSEAEAVETALDRAQKVVRTWGEDGLNRAMEEANLRDLDPDRGRP